MNSKKTTFLVMALAIVGTGLFYAVDTIHPAISFLVGVVATTFIVSSASSSTQTHSSSSVSNATNSDLEPTQTLYVGNLPYKANESNVRELFSEYGRVHAVRLMKDKRTGKRRGFGFVVVHESDSSAVIEALNEKDYMQRTLKVRIANDPKHPETSDA